MTTEVQEAMNELREFWKKAYRRRSYEAWLEGIQGKSGSEALLGAIHPLDLSPLEDKAKEGTCFDEEAGLGPHWWKKDEHKRFLADVNGFDSGDEKRLALWSSGEGEPNPIPAHAYFGDAERAQIVLLGINPQFDPVRDINEQRKVMDSILQRGNYKAEPFLPWGQGETGWAWHQSVYAGLKEWWKGASPEKLFQFEGFPYATHGAINIPARYRKGEAILPSQTKALNLLISLINDDSCERVFITSGGPLNYWTPLIKASHYDEEQSQRTLQRFTDKVLLVKNGLVRNPRLTNLCTVKTRKGNKKLTDKDKKKQLKAVRCLLKESDLLLE